MGWRRLPACARLAALVADCLPEIRSRVTTEHIDRLVFEFAMD